jgi:hypothetical protein
LALDEFLVPESDEMDHFERAFSRQNRNSGRRVAKEAQIIPRPGSIADHIPISETSAAQKES